MDINTPVELVQIRNAVEKWRQSFTSGRQAMQEALIMSAIHAEKYHNSTAMEVIVDALDHEDAKGQNNVAVVEWINRYTKVHVSYSKEAKKHKCEFAPKKTTMLDKAKENPWWQLKAQKQFTGFNFEQALAAQDQLANKKLKEKQALKEAGKEKEAAMIDIDTDLMKAVRMLRTDKRLVEMVLQTLNKDKGVEIINKEGEAEEKAA